MLRLILATTILLAPILAFADAKSPNEDVQWQGRTFATSVRDVTTSAVCVVSYNASQCEGNAVPFACCTAVATGATCTCSGGTTYGGNVISITLQNINGSAAYCSEGTPTAGTAATATNFLLAAGASVTFNGAARGVKVNCITNTGTARIATIIESR